MPLPTLTKVKRNGRWYWAVTYSGMTRYFPESKDWLATSIYRQALSLVLQSEQQPASEASSDASSDESS